MCRFPSNRMTKIQPKAARTVRFLHLSRILCVFALLAHLGPFKASVMLESVFSLNTCKMEITHALASHLPNGGNRSGEYVRDLKLEL